MVRWWVIFWQRSVMEERDTEAAEAPPGFAAKPGVGEVTSESAVPLAGLLRASTAEVLGPGSTPRERRRLMVALQHSAGNAAVNRLLRQLAPAAATTGAPSRNPGTLTAPPTRLVADASSTLLDGQMRISDFAQQLQSSLCSLADSMLGDQAQGCPWIAYWISSYRSLDPAEIEQVLVRYAPAATDADTAGGLITAVGDRVRAGIASWQQTGRIDADASMLVPGAAADDKADDGARVSFIAADGPARLGTTGADPGAVLAQLGSGRPLEPAVGSRMGAALDADFTSVRVHDDPSGAATASALGATALAVGSHIAFAPNQYVPGTPIGDALIAHELAHVVQQSDPRPLARAHDSDADLEADANAAAASAIAVLYGGAPARRGLGRAHRTRLQLQSCRSTVPPSRTTAHGTNLLAGTHTVTGDEHAQIESILHPGSTVVVAPPPPVGAPAPPPVVAPPPAMTGAGPGGALETEMNAHLNAFVHPHAVAFATMKAGGKTLPDAVATPMVQKAQAIVETKYQPWIDAASHEAGDPYSRGTYHMETHIHDLTLAPVDRQFWVGYWMTYVGIGQEVLDSHHVDTNRDVVEFTRIRDTYIAAHGAEIDDCVHTWPAYGQGSELYYQPYPDISGPNGARRARWDFFTTMVHEFLHKLMHPNFERAELAIGGPAQMILREGVVEILRREIWDGPSGLQAKIASDAGLRQLVEGGAFPYDASAVVYHGDYPQRAQAQQIVAQVGLDNVKAAFFLGRVDMLGIGPSSAHDTPLDHIAEWNPTDATDTEIYVATVGETVTQIAIKCGVDDAAVKDATGAALPAGFAATAGQRLKIAGIRYEHAIRGDTLASLARQNGVTPDSIARANGFPAGSPDSTLVPAGRRALIPRPHP